MKKKKNRYQNRIQYNNSYNYRYIFYLHYNNTFSDSTKMGTSSNIGVTINYWYNYQVNCNQKADAVNNNYANIVFLNIISPQTQEPYGFRPTTNNGYN